MKPFDEFVKKGIIRKQSPEMPKAKNLLGETERKERNLRELIEKIGLKEDNANDIIENCYSILMFLIRAKLSLEGYKSSGYSAHEAEISFMQKLGFSENEMNFMDELRRFRNQINYEGKKFDVEYAEKILDFTKKISIKLKKMLGKM